MSLYKPSSKNVPSKEHELDSQSATGTLDPDTLDSDKTDSSIADNQVVADEQAEANGDDENKDNRQKENRPDAGAQHPEPKITMTSPSPDVVIATVETPDPETQLSIEVLKSEVEKKDGTQAADEEAEAVDQQEAMSEQVDSASTNSTNLANIDDIDDGSDNASIDNSNLSPKENLIEDNLVEEKTIKDNIDKIKKPNIDDSQNTEAAAEEVIEKEQEEVKDKKEAKLESYKQFVAEQFSNQKVDYPEVRITIEANALPSRMYFIMNVLSAIIASYGLVTNSAAVVIGAMLVAMMLGPITGVALAIIDYRMPLLRKSLFTVAAGISLVVLVGYVVGYLHQGQPLTSEVLSRTQPTSMDLMIALAGGTAGAYAMVSPHLSVAVVGVAVATALVPPLAASGILFANGEAQLGLGALLLAITNIIAIQFTNAMVLWFLGFRRLVDDDYKSNTFLTFLRRNAVTLLLLIGLGIYLTLNLNSNAKQQTFENNVKEAINSHFIDKGNVLTNTQFDNTDSHQTIRAVIRGETSPTSYDVQQIEAVITQDMADNFPDYLPVKLQLRYLPVQVIESDPLIQDKLDKTDAAILTN